MKSYISYFKLKFITGLSYRAQAIAGIMTQFFFGFVYISVYVAFYESNHSSLPMELDEIVGYLWMSQSLFSLIYLWYKDSEIINMIKTGNIAYELLRPQNLYFMWCSKILGERLSRVTLRFLPVIIIAVLLPKPYNLDISITAFRLLLFIVSMIFSSILMTVLVCLYHVICLFTLDERGVVNIFMVIADILSGLVIPVPFFPKFMQNISNILPFRYISDFPFRLYVGNIDFNEIFISLGMQIIWILILFILGKMLTNKALKRVVVQGG